MVVVAAVDRSGGERIVEEGRKTADAHGLPLHVVHTISEADFRDLERASYDTSGKSLDMAQIESLAETIAEEAVTEAGVEAEEVVGLVGKPSQRVLEYADDVDADYVVVGGRKRSSVGKVLFGSVTQSILLNAECPVITVMEE
ncbi:universal stress protein [Haloplanus rubicundus]|uniref:Universal stress protein n=1 Tax=Haloplanus rubicundus TaxID=1547898 RepID=A0A345DZ22_9EURY|nr:universal stress protein [Haloplanus rubicundus]AXG05194.1 universal stress protein [Haloplanus rubicundus]AXG08519.1 universal stress protein [Haloplanus rubicundus]